MEKRREIIAVLCFLFLMVCQSAVSHQGGGRLENSPNHVTPLRTEDAEPLLRNSSKAPTFVGLMDLQDGRGGVTVNALYVVVGSYWMWKQDVLCRFPNASTAMFGSHQSSYARERGLLYKALLFGSEQKIVKVTIDNGSFSCKVLGTNFPIVAGEYRIDIFPDQAAENSKPTIVGALNGSPSQEYVLFELLREDSDAPEFSKVMSASLKHQVLQVFGSYYDSKTMLLYLGFNEGHSFFDVNPCWLMVVDMKDRQVLSATFYQHLSGYDIWFDRALQTFFIPTSDDCNEPNKTGCFQGVREWHPTNNSLSDIQTNFCHGTACFIFEVGYGYAYNPSNHTAIMYGGVSGWWWYDVTNHRLGQFDSNTVFLISPVYVGEFPP